MAEPKTHFKATLAGTGPTSVQSRRFVITPPRKDVERTTDPETGEIIETPIVLPAYLTIGVQGVKAITMTHEKFNDFMTLVDPLVKSAPELSEVTQA